MRSVKDKPFYCQSALDSIPFQGSVLLQLEMAVSAGCIPRRRILAAALIVLLCLVSTSAIFLSGTVACEILLEVWAAHGHRHRLTGLGAVCLSCARCYARAVRGRQTSGCSSRVCPRRFTASTATHARHGCFHAALLPVVTVRVGNQAVIFLLLDVVCIEKMHVSRIL